MTLNPGLTPTLDEAISKFDRTAHAAGGIAAEQQRAEIVKLFPLSAWSTLALERYAVGMGDVETYCRLVEFRATDLGSIAGGSSFKLIIFRRKIGAWAFPPEFASHNEAWTAIRDGFVHAFELAESGRWAEISSIEALQRGSALTLKSLHVYFPQEVLPVYSQRHLPHYLKLVNPHAPELELDDALLTNRALYRSLRDRTELKDFTTYELGRFLYEWADPREQRRVVKIAPGHDAEFWAECLRDGYVCVGWDGTGDLRDFDDKKQFRARFAELNESGYATTSKISAKANEVWKLIELEPGDIVIANHGKTRVLAVGEVQDPGYQFRAERPKFRHTVRVKWDSSYAQDIAPVESWGMTTVAKVAPELYRTILEKKGAPLTQKPPHGPIPVPADPIFGEISAALERRGQVILFGPPGIA